MSEHAIVQPQKTNAPQIMGHTTALQRKVTNQPAVLPERLFDTVSGTFAEPRFGYNFCRLRLHAVEALPRLRAPAMVQRSPSDGATASEPDVASPEVETTPLPAPAGPTPESASPMPETMPAPAEPAPKAATADELAAPGLLVEDSATEVAPDQMKKSEFLAELRVAVCAAAEPVLVRTGRTTEGCPHLDYWFDYYAQHDAAHVERALRRYAPAAASASAASEYVSIVADRVRQGMERWSETGEFAGVPDGIPIGLPGTGLLGESVSRIGRLSLEARGCEAKSTDDPQAIQAQLGDGQGLDSNVRSRMESAFGTNLGRVRVHSDANAAGLSSRLDAHAFTVGEHVGFGAGEYQPGTLFGDALIAHELAHVVQQGGALEPVAPMDVGSVGYAALEKDADRAAVSVVTALWGEAREHVKDIAQETTPRLRSGLRLQRCGGRRPTTRTPEATPGAEAQEQQEQEGARPTLNLTPGNQLTRGQTLEATVRFSPDAGETLNVVGWEYETADHGTVTRPTDEANWEGTMALSGTLRMAYQITPPGGNPSPEESVEVEITVGDRTGAPWQSSLTEEGENPFTGQPSPPRQFRQLGRHWARANPLPNPSSDTITGGPNDQFDYVSALTAGTFISQPLIHPDLANPASQFFRFHQNASRLYLADGGTRTLISINEYSNLQVTADTVAFDVPDWESFYKAHNFYEVTARAGADTVTLADNQWRLESNDEDAGAVAVDDAVVRGLLGIPNTETFEIIATPQGEWDGFELMQSNAILLGTQRHEYTHQRHSHRANLRAIMRALDPQRKIESTVSSPTNPVDFAAKISDWWSEIEQANASHDLVDEDASREQEEFVSSGQGMAEINVDPDTGDSLGSVWNISADREMT